MEWATILLGMIIGLIVIQLFQIIQNSRRKPPEPEKFHLGDITLRSLGAYNGMDWTKPTLLAIRGKVYDVSNSLEKYSQGKEFGVYAGRDISRALALGSVDAKDLNAGWEGLTAEQAARLDAEEAAFALQHPVVGQVVPLREFTAEEVAAHNGSDPARPMLLSIRGVVYDITAGKAFYGPDGMYPFAGHEVARAFALLSTELSDCTDDLEGLGAMEVSNLKDWEDKFNWKYPIVGYVQGKRPAWA